MEFDCNDARVFAATGGREFNPKLPTISFVHGAAMDHTVWTFFARYFARAGHNVLAFDLPGHGRSAAAPIPTIPGYAQWLMQALDTLGVTSTTLVGHSMGALITLETAGHFPERLTRAVLLGFSCPMQVGPPFLDAARCNHRDAIDMMMVWGHDFLAQIGGNQVPGVNIITNIMRIVEHAAPGVLFNDLNACNNYTNGDAAAAQVQCPVTLILGDRDRMTPLKAAKDFMRHLKDAQLEVIPNCGHGMLEERPEETHKLLVKAMAAAPRHAVAAAR